MAESPNASDIPLSFLDKSSEIESIKIVNSDDFLLDKTTEVKPFDSFDTDDILLFDADKNIIKDSLYKDISGYVYHPTNAVEFSPELFYADIVIKKNLLYNSSRTYNLKICVNELDEELTFSKQLISIFGDAGKRGLCPTSISVNNYAMNPISLIDSSYKENDFIFVKTLDGERIAESSAIDVDAILDDHTNVWLTVPVTYNEETNNIIYKTETISPAQPTLYNSIKAYTVNNTYVDDDNDYLLNTVSSYEDNGYEIDYRYVMFNVYIAHKDMCGYVIISYENFLDNLSANVKAIYDILMYVYLQSYIKITSDITFITDYPIDYYMNTSNQFKKNHKDINTDTILKKITDCKIDTYSVMSVTVDNVNVVFNKMDTRNNLLFSKMGGTNDPVKNSGEISLYTSKGTVITYTNDNAAKIESQALINYAINDSNIIVSLSPMYSSQYKIRITETKNFYITDYDKSYYLIALPVNSEDESDVLLTAKSDYDNSGIIIADIEIVKKTTNQSYDVRLLGGGLAYSAESDYDLLDISNVNGKPYRVGASGIIRVPKILKSEEEKILDAVNKHCIATDYYIIEYF
jgi:hypothetical protein